MLKLVCLRKPNGRSSLASAGRGEESPDSRKAGDPAQAGTRKRWCSDTERGRGTDPELTGFESHRDERLPKPYGMVDE